MTSDHSPKSVRHKRGPSEPKKSTPPQQVAAARIRLPSYIPAVVFLVFALGFACFWINPALHFQARMPLFFSGTPFLNEMAARPGGVLRYACNFLEHLYRTPSMGALLMTAVLGAWWVVLHALARTMRAKEGLVPLAVGALLVLETRYDFPWLETGFGFLLAAGAGLFYLRMPLRTTAGRLAVFGGFSVLLNFVAGVVPGAAFLLIAGVGEQLRRENANTCQLGADEQAAPSKTEATGRALSVGVLVVGLIVGAGVAQFYRVSDLLLPWKTSSDRISVGVFYFCGLVPWLCFALKRRGSFFELPGFQWAVVGASFLVAFGIADGTRKAALEVEYFTDRGEWEHALRSVHKLKAYNNAICVNINRALYHQGRMLDAYFGYWRWPDQPLLPGPEAGLGVCRASGETLLELGQVNLAEHLAHEALESEGERPCVLQLLFKIEMVKGHFQAARTFLGLLRKNPFYRGWAESYLTRMNEDPMLSSDPELAKLRSFRVETDYPGEVLPPYAILLQCLDANPKNRMAFEYLMAHYMASIKPDGVVKNLGRLNDVGIPNLPVLLQEAVLAHRQVVYQETGKLPEVNLYGRSIDPAVQQRFDRFGSILVGNKGDILKSQLALGLEMGSSYFYYSVYTHTMFKPDAKDSSL